MQIFTQNSLEKLLENFTIDDCIEIESSDLQFIALKKMYSNIKDKKYYLSLILVNSLICYQLSSSWEKYWQEFSEKAGEYVNNNLGMNNFILDFFTEFLPKSKWNKRFVNIKLKRIEKIIPFLGKFIWNEEDYYENMLNLRDELAKIMNQKQTAKTIVFAVKMFSYWARVFFDKIIYFPEEISIPIDSRLTNIYEKYKSGSENVDEFYNNLSKKLSIPSLHLDAILWVNYNKFIK